MKELFYIIEMKTKTNKSLYLGELKNGCLGWTFDYNESIWFETCESAENFCKKYFKNFKDWNIKEITYCNIN